MLKPHLVFDYDCTLTKRHTGGVYQKLTPEDMLEPWILRNIVIQADNLQIPLSICTHGNSRQMIEESLLELCGLTEDHIAPIAIICGNSGDKNNHVRQALEFHNIPQIKQHGKLFERYAATTFLFEDDYTNAENAAREGALAVIVNTCPDSLNPVDYKHLELAVNILQSPYEARNLAAKHAEANNYSALFSGNNSLRR